MQFPFSLASLASQIPFWPSRTPKPKFNFTIGEDVFLPLDLVQMSKPGVASANSAGDLFMLPIRTYDPSNAETQHSILVSSLNASASTLSFAIDERDHVFWLDSRTITHLTHVETEGYPGERLDFVVRELAYEAAPTSSISLLRSSFIGTFPTTGPSDFRYVPEAGQLVFFDQVLSDGRFESRQEEAIFLGDNLPTGYKTLFNLEAEDSVRPVLLSVSLAKTDDQKWVLGSNFTRLTTHEEFPDFSYEPWYRQQVYDVSATNVLYKSGSEQPPNYSRDKVCTCGFTQDLYISRLDGAIIHQRIASGRVVFSVSLNHAGSKAAWFETNKNGGIKLVIYDIDLAIEFSPVDQLDFFPTSLTFSNSGDVLYMTGGNDVLASIYALDVPPIPSALNAVRANSPLNVLLTKPSLSGVQALPDGNLLATHFSYASPSEVLLVRDPHGAKVVEQVTHVNGGIVQRKKLDEGEIFTIPEQKDTHGWLIKPKGWDKDDGNRYPAILIHHSGPPGAWNNQWFKLSNPNVFAAQGFFCVLISYKPPMDRPDARTRCREEPLVAVEKIIKGWQYILATYPEIDPSRTIFIDEDPDQSMLQIIEAKGSRLGLKFKGTYGIFSEGFDMHFDGLTGGAINEQYDFLASVA